MYQTLLDNEYRGLCRRLVLLREVGWGRGGASLWGSEGTGRREPWINSWGIADACHVIQEFAEDP